MRTIKEIYSFGEHKRGEAQSWYARKDDVQIPCSEATIEKLYIKWKAHGSGYKTDTNDFFVYRVTFPGLSVEIN